MVKVTKRCRKVRNFPIWFITQDLDLFQVPTAKFVKSTLNEEKSSSLCYKNTSTSSNTKDLSIRIHVEEKCVAAIQNVAASPLGRRNGPELWDEVHTTPNVSYRYNATYPVPFGILQWAYFEHSMIWFRFGQS